MVGLSAERLTDSLDMNLSKPQVTWRTEEPGMLQSMESQTQTQLNNKMTQQSHSWTYIWTQLQFKKMCAPPLHSSTIHSSQDLGTT